MIGWIGGGPGAGTRRSWVETGHLDKVQRGKKGLRISGDLDARDSKTSGKCGGEARSPELHHGLTKMSTAAASATPSPASCSSSADIPQLHKGGSAERRRAPSSPAPQERPCWPKAAARSATTRPRPATAGTRRHPQRPRAAPPRITRPVPECNAPVLCLTLVP